MLKDALYGADCRTSQESPEVPAITLVEYETVPVPESTQSLVGLVTPYDGEPVGTLMGRLPPNCVYTPRVVPAGRVLPSVVVYPKVVMTCS